MRCAIWYHLYNIKNVKKTHGGVLLLVKLQPATLLKLTLPMGVFYVFKIAQMVPNRATHRNGFDKNALIFLNSYLSNRKERVEINDKYSSWSEILFRVSQGSILGPLLFNVFICDMLYFLEDFDIANYQMTLPHKMQIKILNLLLII